MKSKEEIEKYLGMKIESNKEEQTRDSSYAIPADGMRYVSKYQDTYTVTVKVLPEETVKALKGLIKDSIKIGDLETAATCHSILLEESTFYKGHPNAIGLDMDESMALNKYEAEQKAIEEEQARLKAEQEAKERAAEEARLKAEQEAKEKAEEEARLKAEQEAKEKAEEQARLKAEQEAKERAAEEARLKAEQEAKERAEEQARLKAEQEAKERAAEEARLKAEQEEKERQASIEKDIAEFEQYEELVSRKPELEQLFQDMFYEDFSAASSGKISERMVELLEDLKKLPDNERQIILQRYNGLADLQINENGQIVKDGVVLDLPKRNANKQENSQEEQIEVEISNTGLEEQVEEITSGITYAEVTSDDLEYTRKQPTFEQTQVVEDYMNSVNTQQTKEYEQQQPEKIRPREESIRDEVGDKRDEQFQVQNQDTKAPSIDLWMNRFGSWYSAIDRVSQNVKAKFVKMKSDILNAISNKIKDRMNKREVNIQEQDSSER